MTISTRAHRAMAAAMLGAVALAFAGAPARAALTPVVLAPATFEEFVGIGSYTQRGTDLQSAESLSLTVLSSQFADRGGGVGHAWINPLHPVSTGIDLHLVGGTNSSGIDGTAATATRYQYTVIKLDPQLPDSVNIGFSGYASVSVQTNQPLVTPTWFSYAVLWFDNRQFAVRNSDASGIAG